MGTWEVTGGEVCFDGLCSVLVAVGNWHRLEGVIWFWIQKQNTLMVLITMSLFEVCSRFFFSSFSVSLIYLRTANPLSFSVVNTKQEGEMVDKLLWIWTTAVPLIYFHSILSNVTLDPFSSIYFSQFYLYPRLKFISASYNVLLFVTFISIFSLSFFFSFLCFPSSYLFSPTVIRFSLRWAVYYPWERHLTGVNTLTEWIFHGWR